jgi:hypothetical protein
MDKVIKTQVIECETNGGGGLLVALGNDKFSDDFIKFSDNDYDSDFNKAMYDIDCQVWNFFEFDEYEWLQKPKDLIGKDICIHDQFMEHDDIIIGIDYVGNAEDYFNYKGA